MKRWIKQYLKKSMVAVMIGAFSITAWAQDAPTKACQEAMKTESSRSDNGAVKVAKEVQVKLNGKVVDLEAPIINDGGTILLPVRAVGKLLGIRANYNSDYKVVMLQSGETIVEVPLGYSFGIVNGTKKEIANGKTAISYNGFTYLPVRFVSDCFGAAIMYKSDTKTIEIGEMKDEAEAQITGKTTILYQFRKPAYLTEHFKKHGAEFGYETEAAYLEGANRVIQSKEALHKLEAEDGDHVYYLEATNEIVFLSKDGYIRTYFKPDTGIAYYNKQ